jgi:type IV pilus assembly protein PilA
MATLVAWWNFSRKKTFGGFTLLEIVLVVAAIGILAGIVILALNPAKQLSEARNAQRHADADTILDAVYHYAVDNNGSLPSAITTTPTEICATNAVSCDRLVDLSVLTAQQKYLAAIPVEPQQMGVNGAGYMISKTANGRVMVTAQYPEQGATISITR